MALNDSKKVQTLINNVAHELVAMRNGMVNIKSTRTAYLALNPSTVGTPIDGHVAAINSAVNALDAALSSAEFDLLINNIVPTHEGRSLDG